MLFGFCCGQLRYPFQTGYTGGYAAGGFLRCLLKHSTGGEVSIIALAGTAIAGHELALGVGQAGYGSTVARICVGAHPLRCIMTKVAAGLVAGVGVS